MRKLSIIAGLLAFLLFTTSQAQALECVTWDYQYDGCTWDLEGHNWVGRPGQTKVEEEGTGCHYLTAYAKDKSGEEYHRVGPKNASVVTADMVGSDLDFYARGKITTWEHEWTQDSGWRWVDCW